MGRKGHGSIGIYNPEYIKSKIQKLIHNREQYFLPTFYRLEDLRKLKDLIVDAFIEILKELEYTYNSIIKLGEKYKENNEVGFSSRENYRTKKFKTIIDKRNNFDFRYQESQGQAYSEKYTLNSGEIDLLVKFKRNDVMIIEALNLNSLKIEYLSNHYSKLIKGYNPLGLPNLCMMVYFEGRDFKNFKEGYISYLKSVKTFGEGINLINISVKGTEELNYDEIINPSNLGDYHHVAVIEHIITYNKFDYKILHLIGNFNWNESI
ncbi:MAG: hypothetical protein IPN97_06880 [Saprospiraceae bacterium]|nr:hypothetical protein [Saprospiraceae bacterium]